MYFWKLRGHGRVPRACPVESQHHEESDDICIAIVRAVTVVFEKVLARTQIIAL